MQVQCAKNTRGVRGDSMGCYVYRTKINTKTGNFYGKDGELLS